MILLALTLTYECRREFNDSTSQEDYQEVFFYLIGRNVFLEYDMNEGQFFATVQMI